MTVSKRSIIGYLASVSFFIIVVFIVYSINDSWGLKSWLICIISIAAILQNIFETMMTYKEPMTFEDSHLVFYKKRKKITIPKRQINEVFLKKSLIREQAVIRTDDGNEIAVPQGYGRNALIKKINKTITGA